MKTVRFYHNDRWLGFISVPISVILYAFHII